jgi:ABC-2 type transport system ATP-binding protein
MPRAIALRNLSKRYGRVEALRDATLEVATGEIFGFLGPNGAGKTTTIRLLLDLLRPTAGRAEIFGLDCRRDSRRVRAQVGYLPSELALPGDLTGADALAFLGRLSGAPVAAARRAALLDRLELAGSDLQRKVREYSSGMRRKLGLVQAFQHDPPLLILDEPTEGLDPLMRETFFELVQEARKNGATLFISSHVLGEVDRLCDRIALLREGRVILTGEVSEVRRLAPRTVRIAFDADVPSPQLPEGFELLAVTPRSWSVRARGELRALFEAARGTPIRDVEVDVARLEDVIVEYYRKAAE